MAKHNQFIQANLLGCALQNSGANLRETQNILNSLEHTIAFGCSSRSRFVHLELTTLQMAIILKLWPRGLYYE